MNDKTPSFGLFRQDVAGGVWGCYGIFLGVAFIPFGVYLAYILDKPFHWVGVGMAGLAAVFLLAGSVAWRGSRRRNRTQMLLEGISGGPEGLSAGHFRAVLQPQENLQAWQPRRIDRLEAIQTVPLDPADGPMPLLVIVVGVTDKKKCGLAGFVLMEEGKEIASYSADKALLWALRDGSLEVMRSDAEADPRKTADDLELLGGANRSLGRLAFQVRLLFAFRSTVGPGGLVGVAMDAVRDAVAYRAAKKAVLEGKLVDEQTGRRMLAIAEENGWEVSVKYT